MDKYYDKNGVGPTGEGHMPRKEYEEHFGERRPSLAEVRTDPGIGDHKRWERLHPNVKQSINKKIGHLEKAYESRHDGMKEHEQDHWKKD